MSELERALAGAKDAAAHLRKGAASYRFLANERRGPVDAVVLIEMAEKWEHWANAIDALVRLIEGEPR